MKIFLAALQLIPPPLVITDVVYSLQNFTDCFTTFVDQDVIDKCQQERELLEKFLEQVCTRVHVRYEFCHPDIKSA